MNTSNKRHKHSSHNQHANDTPPTISNNDIYDLVSDHSFIAPYEICGIAVGLLSILINRHTIDMSFSKLYQLSLKLGWEKIFLQERQKLKPNDISVLKCFVLNRFLHEYIKAADVFEHRTKILFDTIKLRMTRDFPEWTPEDLFDKVRRWQDIQCRRRLFCFHHQEVDQLPSLLMLQKASTNWCHCLINHYQEDKNSWQTDGGRQRFSEHFQNSFIIVAQPTGSEGAAVTQYIKNTTGHSARLNTRIICLLDPDILKDSIELSNIDVTLYPLNRETNDKQEKQPSIKWEIKKVMSTEGTPVSILYAEINTLQLEKFDSVCKRLSFNSTLCQLEFRFKIKLKNPEFEESILLTTQPFGICSHAQYFPKFVAQIFLYEMKQVLKNDNITDPDIISEFIRRYFTRMTGIEPTDHTNRYIREVFAKAIEGVKSTRVTNTLDNVCEEILAKIISQIDFMVLNPFLSLMYDDNLFLGICNSTEVDKMLYGTRDQPHMLLRFNNLMNHQCNGNVIVQLIIHDGNLNKASFDMKTFANEMCRFICESLGDKTKQGLILSAMKPRSFTDFQWYFHDELYRLNKMVAPNTDLYDPLLPVLWMTMRQNYDHNVLQTDVTSTNMIHSRKRSRSDSLPFIDSVSSIPQSTTTNIVVHLDSMHNCSLQSTNVHCSKSPKSTTDSSLAVVEKVCQSNNQESTTRNGQIIIEMHGNIDISPAVIFHYLAEKLAHAPDDHNEDELPNYFIRPQETTVSLANIMNSNGSRDTKSAMDHSTINSNSLSEISKIESSLLTNGIHNDTSNQLKIKEEPHDVDYTIFNGPVNCE